MSLIEKLKVLRTREWAEVTGLGVALGLECSCQVPRRPSQCPTLPRYSEAAIRIVGPCFGLCRLVGTGLSRGFEGKGRRRLDKGVWLGGFGAVEGHDLGLAASSIKG